MAYWGVAMDLLGNTLVGPPPRTDAEAAWAALEKARAIGAKTQRERDWIEALTAYYRDYDKVAVDARLAAYNAAMERLAERYPDDYEAKAFYALTLQASAPKSDLTTPTSSSQRAFWRNSTSRTRNIPACPTTSSTLTISRRSPTKASRPRGAMLASRRPSRTPATCRRTSIQWSGCGRNR